MKGFITALIILAVTVGVVIGCDIATDSFYDHAIEQVKKSTPTKEGAERLYDLAAEIREKEKYLCHISDRRRTENLYRLITQAAAHAEEGNVAQYKRTVTEVSALKGR